MYPPNVQNSPLWPNSAKYAFAVKLLSWFIFKISFKGAKMIWIAMTLPVRNVTDLLENVMAVVAIMIALNPHQDAIDTVENAVVAM